MILTCSTFPRKIPWVLPQGFQPLDSHGVRSLNMFHSSFSHGYVGTAPVALVLIWYDPS